MKGPTEAARLFEEELVHAIIVMGATENGDVSAELGPARATRGIPLEAKVVGYTIEHRLRRGAVVQETRRGIGRIHHDAITRCAPGTRGAAGAETRTKRTVTFINAEGRTHVDIEIHAWGGRSTSDRASRDVDIDSAVPGMGCVVSCDFTKALENSPRHG